MPDKVIVVWTGGSKEKANTGNVCEEHVPSRDALTANILMVNLPINPSTGMAFHVGVCVAV